MIKFAKKAEKIEKINELYNRKPLPPEPGHLQRFLGERDSGSRKASLNFTEDNHHYDLPPPVSIRNESLQTTGYNNPKLQESSQHRNSVNS